MMGRLCRISLHAPCALRANHDGSGHGSAGAAIGGIIAIDVYVNVNSTGTTAPHTPFAPVTERRHDRPVR